ncbi:hypothetical protein OG609_01240 [Streptomyces sp. NBC_01224]|uniref:hypothetical protein n=1 Tax=unclassified Streptomyces TaxID=2593676 RepID=UPI002E0F583E|nr:hypothetical protein OG609_01240 [Streptomyces sp. NBC_01224]
MTSVMASGDGLKYRFHVFRLEMPRFGHEYQQARSGLPEAGRPGVRARTYSVRAGTVVSSAQTSRDIA